MKSNPLLIAVCVALALLAMPRTIQAQKDGDAQNVFFDTQDRPTLKFAAKNEKLDCCGLFVSYTVIDNGEEALAVRADHAHRQGWGAITFPERGWLYITSSRVVFLVEEGDKSHGFDLPRTALMDEPGSSPKVDWSLNKWSGIQINLRERQAASNSREQKFSFPSWQTSKCKLYDESRFNEFVKRIVNDFANTLAEFKQLATSLKETGKSQQSGLVVPPPAEPIKMIAAASGGNTSSGPKGAKHVTTGVEIKAKPAAEVYIDGQFQSSKTPFKVTLSSGEHTVRLLRCGYKVWEQKITVEEGALTKLEATLEKQEP